MSVAGTASAAAPRRLTVPSWLAVAALAALLALVYHGTFARLWSIWTTDENYSHGPLVPVVALGLAWMRRATWSALPLGPDSRGLALVALACVLQIAGLRGDVFTLEACSFLVMVVGLAWTFLGPACTRVLAPALGFLVFMMPFPNAFVVHLSYALKEITVRLSTAIAEGLGVVLMRDGMTLVLQNGELHVENPCSGLRSLMALLATGAVFGVLQPGGWWRRVTLFLAAVPVAMLGNALRIALLIVIAHYAGVRQATGAIHDASGYLIYAFALAAMLGLRRLLTPRPQGTP